MILDRILPDRLPLPSRRYVIRYFPSVFQIVTAHMIFSKSSSTMMRPSAKFQLVLGEKYLRCEVV